MQVLPLRSIDVNSGNRILTATNPHEFIPFHGLVVQWVAPFKQIINITFCIES